MACTDTCESNPLRAELFKDALKTQIVADRSAIRTLDRGAIHDNPKRGEPTTKVAGTAERADDLPTHSSGIIFNV